MKYFFEIKLLKLKVLLESMMYLGFPLDRNDLTQKEKYRDMVKIYLILVGRDILRRAIWSIRYHVH